MVGILSGILGQNSTLIFFLENWHTRVKKHALSEFGSTETLAPAITGKITKNRKFHGKNTVTSGPVGVELIFFQKMKFQTFFLSIVKKLEAAIGGNIFKSALEKF